MVSMLDGISHHIIKHLTAATFQEHLVALFGNNANTKNGRVKHCSRVILRKQQVAATAQEQQRFICLTQGGDYLLSLFYRSIFHKSTATGINTKGVVPQQAVISYIFHSYIPYYI